MNKQQFLQNGFTLVEAVVAITIIGIIGVIMSDILTRAFDNTRKTNLISNVQQNGQAALGAFEDTIRYAEFVCVGGYDADGIERERNLSQLEYHSPVLVVFKDGRFIRFRLVPEKVAAGTNGYIAEDFPAPPVVGTTHTDLCKAPITSVNLRKITNDSMLSVKHGTITLLSNPVNTTNNIGTTKVSMTIIFAIGSTVGSSATPENQIGQNNEILFQTTAQFR